MRSTRLTTLIATLLCLSLTTNELLAQRSTLMFEDFESLPLGESVDEVQFAEEVWTNVPPDGWSIENDLPGLEDDGIGVTEWKGWSFADKDWWVSAAEDQRRSEFTLGEGTVAIADPDEWDDLGGPTGLGLYNTWMTTDPISLSGVQAKSLELSFVSSWRPEGFDDRDFINNQTAQITVSFDGGPDQEVMLWDSDAGSETYHDHFPDEEVYLTIDNPAGASQMTITFGLLLSYNDWWWAIDNLELTGVVSGPTGDFNGNGQLDTADIDQLDVAIRGGSHPAKFDLNGDAKVDGADQRVWVIDLKKTYFGDSNLDGEFNSGDFVNVFQRGEFEDNIAGNSSWEDGDWNSDGDFTSGDFVTAFQDGGFEAGPRAAVAAVPEPATLGLLLLGGACCLVRRR